MFVNLGLNFIILEILSEVLEQGIAVTHQPLLKVCHQIVEHCGSVILAVLEKLIVYHQIVKVDVEVQSRLLGTPVAQRKRELVNQLRVAHVPKHLALFVHRTANLL